MNTFKVAFAGTPEFAVPSLTALLADPEFTVVAVYTQPDRPAGRGRQIAKSPVKILAEEAGIPVHQPTKLDETEITNIRKNALDFLVVVAYGLLLPPEILQLPQHSCLNVHASLLPQYRGASPIQQAILNNDAETGVSYMRLEAGLDTGPVFTQEIIKLKNTETGAELTTQLAELGGSHLPAVLTQIATGELQATKQDNSKASTCSKVKKSDGRIDWQKDSAESINRKLRAYTPWPGIWTEYKGKRLKILEIEIPSSPLSKSGEVGTVFKQDEKVYVQAVDQAIELKKVQMEGKQELEVQEFVRGETEFAGGVLR